MRRFAITEFSDDSSILCVGAVRVKKACEMRSVLSLRQQRGKCSLSYRKVMNKKDASAKCCACSTTKGEFQKAGFVSVQPFVTTLGARAWEHRFMEAT